MTRSNKRDLISTGAAKEKLERIAKVILVGSGKGGVGKSTVASGLALSLSHEGQMTALLDIDIHGASVPEYLEVSPPVRSSKKGLEPKMKDGLKVMSLGLFTGNLPVPMRGEDKQELITQLFALTNWGELDYLVVDLPPSMGDELLSAFSLFSGKATLALVTTPSPGAVSVVSRLRRLAETEKVTVQGIIVNMAYAHAGKTKTFPFGRPDHKLLEAKFKSTIIVEIPLEPLISARGLNAVLKEPNDFSRAFQKLTEYINR
jgi:ATP-binding protein involved in chromosome partitioning